MIFKVVLVIRTNNLIVLNSNSNSFVSKAMPYQMQHFDFCQLHITTISRNHNSIHNFLLCLRNCIIPFQRTKLLESRITGELTSNEILKLKLKQ